MSGIGEEIFDLDKCDEEIRKIDETEGPLVLSKDYKLQMNRFFREFVRSAYLPYPEVDDFFKGSEVIFV